MSTRRLILTALVCGIAILASGVAFFARLVRHRSDLTVDSILAVGQPARVGDAAVTVRSASTVGGQLQVVVTVDRGAAAAAADPAASGSVPPGSAAPGSVGPGSVAPGSVAPGSAAPGSVAPGSVAPGSVTPGSVAGAGSPTTVPSADKPWSLVQGSLRPKVVPEAPPGGQPAAQACSTVTLQPGRAVTCVVAFEPATGPAFAAFEWQGAHGRWRL